MQKIQKKFNVSLRPNSLIFTLKIALVAALATTLSCSQKGVNVSADNQPTSPELVAKGIDEISVMTFNVENLFDATHDKDREDYTYLPLADKKTPEVEKFCSAMSNPYYREECFNLDWNEDVIQTKLKNVGEVIRYVDNGQGPDNLFLAEVENESILKRLVSDQLGNLGYKTVVLIEGPDMRGIDPAFISKFPLLQKKLHLIPYTDSNPARLKSALRSRGILEVVVRAPNGKPITFLVAHFPSQSNPTEWRAQAIQFAKKLMTQYQQEGRAVVFGGDLNIIDAEEKEKGYFRNEMSQVGDVSHLVGCKTCLGTHNYRGEWSHLDVLIYSKNLKNLGMALVPDSIQVVHVPIHMRRDGTPLRFNAEKKEGVADHFPLFSRIQILKAK